jgi:hypothetical protein
MSEEEPSFASMDRTQPHTARWTAHGKDVTVKAGNYRTLSSCHGIGSLHGGGE